jgi:hypothetical protein
MKRATWIPYFDFGKTNICLRLRRPRPNTFSSVKWTLSYSSVNLDTASAPWYVLIKREAPISAFDQVLTEDTEVNRVEDSVLLFRTICRSKLLANVSPDLPIAFSKLYANVASYQRPISFCSWIRLAPNQVGRRHVLFLNCNPSATSWRQSSRLALKSISISSHIKEPMTLRVSQSVRFIAVVVNE